MRRSFTLFSIVVHAIVITAALIAQVLAVGALPTPHQPVFFDAAAVMPIDIQLPKPRARDRVAPADRLGQRRADRRRPTGVAAETGREGEPTAADTGVVSASRPDRHPPHRGRRRRGTAPPPPPPPATPMRLHSGMTGAGEDRRRRAGVSARSRSSAHVQGVVILEAVLDAQGRVDRCACCDRFRCSIRRRSTPCGSGASRRRC